MENIERDRLLIMRYIDGALTEQEQAEMDYRLREETGLQNMLRDYEALAKGVRLAHLHEKLQQLRSLEASLPPVEARVVSLRRYWIPLSAAAAIIIAAGIWFLMPTSSPADHQDLYAAYFEPFDSPGSGLTRSTDTKVGLKAQAYEAYDAGDYAQASRLFETLLKEKDEPIVHLCLGNTWLALDQPEKAEAVFIHVLEEHSDLVTQAKWYLALTFLRQGRIERTKATLWEISKSSTYGEEARELLTKLD